MTRRLIRAEIEAQAGTRWADFILQEGEFAGSRDSYPPKGRREMAAMPEPQMLDRSPIASRHIAETGTSPKPAKRCWKRHAATGRRACGSQLQRRGSALPMEAPCGTT